MPKPAKLAFDFTRMSPGGSNGGIKIHLFAFLAKLAKIERYQLHLLCSENLVPELSFMRTDDWRHQIHIIRPDNLAEIRDIAHTLPLIKRWPQPPKNLLEHIGADLLYAGFGFSEFHSSAIPQISLIVDCLHTDLPEHLPKAEVNARSDWFTSTIEESTLIQTNSDFCIDRIEAKFSVDREKLFKIYLPLHERFGSIPTEDCPENLLNKKFFFYPANYWPHKNHEGLLIAYHQYLRTTSESPWDLVLTGDLECEGAKQAIQHAETLNIRDKIHFLGHLSDETLKRIWEETNALVFPSLYEGFGIPIVEAMHFQTPIACSEVASIPEVAGNAALYFNPRKPMEIARAMESLSSDEGLQKDLIAKGVQRLPSFSFEQESNLLIEKIDELLNKVKPNNSNVTKHHSV